MDHPFRLALEEDLASFHRWLSESGWRGRENEVVNQFAHRILAGRVARTSLTGDGPLRDLTQLGIEVSVEQVVTEPTKKGNGRKKEVRKDLVIWRDGERSSYDEDWRIRTAPLAIIEWKARHEKAQLHEADLEFLRAFTALDRYRDTLGVAVSVDFNPARVKAQFVSEGQTSALLEWPPK